MYRVDRLVSQFGIKQENNLRCNVETVPCSWLQFSRIVTPCCDASSRRLRPSPLPRSPNRRRRTIRDGWTGRSWVLRCYWVAHQLWEPSDSLLTIQKSNSIVKKKIEISKRMKQPMYRDVLDQSLLTTLWKWWSSIYIY